jgi:hypothetical protein
LLLQSLLQLLLAVLQFSNLLPAARAHKHLKKGQQQQQHLLVSTEKFTSNVTLVSVQQNSYAWQHECYYITIPNSGAHL